MLPYTAIDGLTKMRSVYGFGEPDNPFGARRRGVDVVDRGAGKDRPPTDGAGHDETGQAVDVKVVNRS